MSQLLARLVVARSSTTREEDPRSKASESVWQDNRGYPDSIVSSLSWIDYIHSSTNIVSQTNSNKKQTNNNKQTSLFTMVCTFDPWKLYNITNIRDETFGHTIRCMLLYPSCSKVFCHGSLGTSIKGTQHSKVRFRYKNLNMENHNFLLVYQILYKYVKIN